MNTTTLLLLLSVFSVISSLVTESIKTLVTDKANLPCNIIALATALIVGSGGTAVFYQLNTIPLTINNIIYMILMGLASGLVSMTSYDKVKQAIEQLMNPKG